MGFGAAASEPGTLSMIRHIYPERSSRAKALGVWAAVSACPRNGAPHRRRAGWGLLVPGGLLVQPVLRLVALIGAALILPESANPVRFRLDFAGFLLGAGVSHPLRRHHPGRVGRLQELPDRDAVRRRVGPPVFFVLYERRVAHPILDVSSSGVRPLQAAMSSRSAHISALSRSSSSSLCISRTSDELGLRDALDFVPMATAMIVASLFAGRWVARSGPRMPMTVGCVLAGIGIILTEVVLTPALDCQPRLDAPDSRCGSESR